MNLLCVGFGRRQVSSTDNIVRGMVVKPVCFCAILSLIEPTQLWLSVMQRHLGIMPFLPDSKLHAVLKVRPHQHRTDWQCWAWCIPGDGLPFGLPDCTAELCSTCHQSEPRSFLWVFSPASCPLCMQRSRVVLDAILIILKIVLIQCWLY